VAPNNERKDRTVSDAKGYAVAHLRNIRTGEDIYEYLRSIDATLQPYGGRFLVHGGRVEGIEGRWDAAVVILEFPSPAAAREWYDSPGYQDILPLRRNNSDSVAAILTGVSPGHEAANLVPILQATAA
jgi:uncharacterized protein (DUF1330 family)